MQKSTLEHVIAELPEDNIDVNALIERLQVLQAIEEAEEQFARGEGIPHEEMKRRLQPWLE